MFCISCGAWIGKRADYCHKCKPKPYKERIPEPMPDDIPTERRKKMYEAGKKSVVTRQKQQQELYDKLKDTHYTVKELIQLTGKNKTTICKYIYRNLRKKCIKKFSMYFIPKELLPELERKRK